MIELGQNICSDFQIASQSEWLETNGIGGYASSSVAGANTRRYHGLLVAATKPPLGRIVLLSKFEETLVLEDGSRFDLSCNQYPNAVYPQGFQYLTGFRLDPFPRWTYAIGEIVIEKYVFMIDGENSVVCRWRISQQSAVGSQQPMLELLPLIAFRDHHHLRHEDAAFDGSFSAGEGVVSLAPYPEMPRLYLAHNAIDIEPQYHWYKHFEYGIERERGFDFREDLFQPFSLKFDLSDDVVVIASDNNTSDTPAESLRYVAAKFEAREMKRRAGLIAKSGARDDFSRQLVLAADQFIVSRGTGKSVIAGYHWFSDWGRDTMIAMNGLTLATNRAEIAKSILTEFSKYISEGMLPNRFPDESETPDYNTVDATLWYFQAACAYAEFTDDYDFVRDVLYEKLTDIIDWHIRGTRYQIQVDADGLLYAGEEGVQLTWMDAKIGDWVVTPRTGKPVEIQALWYNALCVMSTLAERFGDAKGKKRFASMAAAAKKSFSSQFWNDEEQCLYDVINGGEKDSSIRPNQIFAVSLPFTMLNAAQARKVVDKVEADLFTPYGLRSLSPRDSRYCGAYTGTPHERDSAYHQGTVWGWLIGPFIDAYRKVHPRGAKTERRVSVIISGLTAHFSETMIGQMSEIFDAEPPYAHRGAAAQAWSVAELLRVTTSQSRNEKGR
ncbi:MAG: amylo-alpha-1,6-glucosidase [Pyrinomonadaceae bacterium]